jgi:large subunit ribosomal protein L10
VNKQEKAAEIQDLKEKFAKSTGVIITEYRGLNVASIQTVRNDFRKEKVEYRVVKNTLAIQAIKGTPHEVLAKDFDGPVAIAIAFGDPIAAAKTALKHAKEFNKLVLKKGYTDGSMFESEAGIDQMSKLPTKDELRAQLIGLLTAGPQKLLGVLNAPAQKFLGVLEARKQQLEEQK